MQKREVGNIKVFLMLILLVVILFILSFFLILYFPYGPGLEPLLGVVDSIYAGVLTAGVLTVIGIMAIIYYVWQRSNKK